MLLGCPFSAREAGTSWPRRLCPKSSARPVAEKTLGKLSAAVEISPYTSKLWGKLYVSGCMQFAQMVPNRTTRSEIKATLWKHVVGSRVQLLVAVKSVSVTSSAGLQHFLLFYIGLKFIFTFCRFSAVEVWRFHLTWVVGMLFSRFRSRNTIIGSLSKRTFQGDAVVKSAKARDSRRRSRAKFNLLRWFPSKRTHHRFPMKLGMLL